jgi:hypothetical protein
LLKNYEISTQKKKKKKEKPLVRNERDLMTIIWEHEIFYAYHLGVGGILCSLHDFQRDLCSLDTIVIGFNK